VTGSIARGTATASSDVDLLALLSDDRAPAEFLTTRILGRAVEVHFASATQLADKAQRNPSLTYGLLEAIRIGGDVRLLQAVQASARRVLDSFSVPASTLYGLRHWLESARTKVQSALLSDHQTKAGFVVSTTTWPLVEALWAVNGKPVPANGQVLDLLPTLSRVPPNCADSMRLLVTAPQEARIRSFLSLADWLCEVLGGGARHDDA
jgi:hypothetical protein